MLVITAVIAQAQLTAALNDDWLEKTGDSDSKLKVIADDGVPPYSYLWSTGSTVDSIMNLGIGVYTVTVSDNVGATVVRSRNIQVIRNLIWIDFITTPETTAGAGDGEIAVVCYGGAMPYTFLWSNGATSQSLSGVSDGQYKLWVTDNNGITDSSFVYLGDYPSINWTWQNTGNNHTMLVPSGLPLSFNGAPASYGDLIGAFYEDAGIMYCAGYTTFQAGNSAITIWGNDETNSIKDGFDKGEHFNWFVYDASEGKSYNTSASYMTNFTAYNNYGQNFISGLATVGEPFESFDLAVGEILSPSNHCEYLNSPVEVVLEIINLGTGTVNSYDVSYSLPNSSTVTETVTTPINSGDTVVYTFTTLFDGSAYSSENTLIIDYGVLTFTDINIANNDTQLELVNTIPYFTIQNDLLNSCQGSITVDSIVSASVNPISTWWNFPSFGSDLMIDSLCEDSYTFYWDDGVCVDSFTIDIINDPLMVLFDITPPTCNSYIDGSITASLNYTSSGIITYNWSNGATSATIDGLNNGMFYVTVSENGLPIVNDSVEMIAPPLLVIDAMITNETAPGSSDGFIDLLLSGGVPPYSYEWSNGSTFENNTSVSVGYHTIVATDDYSCAIEGAFVVNFVNPPPAFVVGETFDTLTCPGECTGEFLLNASGLAPFSYNWSTGDTTNMQDSLCPSSYTVTVTSGAGMVHPPDWDYHVNPNNVNQSYGGFVRVNGATADAGDILGAFYNDNGVLRCAGYGVVSYGQSNYLGTTFHIEGDDMSTPEKDGFDIGEFITFRLWRISDGVIINVDPAYIYSTGPFSIFYGPGSSSAMFEGSYTPPAYAPLTTVYEYEVWELDVIELDSVLTHVDPTLGNNGAIDITVSGGNPPYSYNWSNGSSNEDLNNLGTGQYSVDISDATGCSMNESFVINYDIPLTSVDLSGSSEDATCNQSCDGSIDLALVGGVQPYTYNWSNGSTTEDLNSICAGVYTVTVSDNAASYSASFPYANTLSAFTTVNSNTLIEVCFSANHSYVSDLGFNLISPSGLRIELLPSISSWTNSFTSLDASQVLSCNASDIDNTNANPGNNYQNFCFSSVLPAGDPALTPCIASLPTPITGTFASCESWAELNNEPIIGNWSVQVFDCIGSHVGNLTDVSLSFTNNNGASGTLEYSSGPINVVINDGSCDTISATIYALPNTFGTSSQSTITHEISLPSSLTINGVACQQGDYIALMYDDNGILECSGYTYWTGNADIITARGDDTFTSDKDGFLTGEQFVWQHWNATTGLILNCEATYSSSLPAQGLFAAGGSSSLLSFVGSPNTIVTQSFTITEPDAIESGAIVNFVTPAILNDGAINLNPLGGMAPYSFAWSTGATMEDIINLVYGTYTVTITDAAGCELIESFDVEYNAPYLTFDIYSQDNLCFGDATGTAWVDNIVGVAPFTFSWSNGSSNDSIFGLTAGMYEITVSATNGDVLTEVIEVFEPTELALNLVATNYNAQTQTDGAIDLTVNGGSSPYTYTWSDASTSEDLSAALYGAYVVTVTDANGCQLMDDAFVDFNVVPAWKKEFSGISHNIQIPATAVLELNGVALQSNDFIGVFYDSLGTLSCGGYVVWQENATSIIAFGDDLSTSVKEGFTNNEEFSWYIWDALTATEHPAIASYNTSFTHQELWANNGFSGLDSLQTVTISGSVSTTSKGNLPLGMVVLYEPVLDSYHAVAKGLVVDGQFKIEGIEPGDYLVYAIPQPDNAYGIPGYFVENNKWQGAGLIHAYAHTTGINITLDPVQLYNTGNGAISGNIYVGGDDSYNPNVFGDEWFAGSAKANEVPARNIPVLLYDDQMNVLDFRLSNDQGAFEFNQMELGSYFVRVEKAGLQAEEIEIILTAENPTSDGTIFSLESGQVTGINNMFEQSTILVYPNPVRDELYIRLENITNQNIEIRLLSITGQQIQFPSSIQQSSANILTVNTQSLSAGLYFIEIIEAGKRSIHKINKQ